jgi:hypothetical protein
MLKRKEGTMLIIPAVNEKKAVGFAGTGFLSGNEGETSLRVLPFYLGYLNSSRISGEINGQSNKIVVRDLEGVRSSAVHLGTTTNNVSTSGKYRRYAVLRKVKRIMAGSDARVNSCMKALGNTVAVQRTGDNYHFGGIMACGSVWMCPVCASRISERRRHELQDALDTSGMYPVLITATISHGKRDSLASLLDVLNESLRKLKAGRKWQNLRDKYGICAYASSLEFTYSQETGWHPHKHILLFLKDKIDADAIASLRSDISRCYVSIVGRLGGYASAYHAIDVQAGTDYAGAYLAKWGIVAEVTKSNMKQARKDGSYSVWELAELGESEAWAREAFREYAGATKGKRAITYSHGARGILGMNKDVSDELLAQETEVITTITREAWNKILASGNEVLILELAEHGGKDAVDSYVRGLKEHIRTGFI